MRPKITNAENDFGRPRGRHCQLGIDQEGRVHHYDERSSRILAIRDGEIEHVERFDDADDRDAVVTAWIEFVVDGCGWSERNYVTNHEFDDLAEGARTLGRITEGRA